MSNYFGYRLRFLPAFPARWGILKGLVSYPYQSLQTIALVVKQRPDVLWVQLPPNVLLHLAWILRLIYLGKNLVLVADLHNSAMSRFWFAVPFTKTLLNVFDIVLVHNVEMRSAALERGVKPGRLHVLEDRLPTLAYEGETLPPKGRPLFVVPCSFDEDEPIWNVIEAARRLPDFDFKITGHRTRAQDRGFLHETPGNVTFTDFLSVNDYERLLASASGILCLTTRGGIQLSAASEAVGAGKPMIISDTPLLRSLFETGYFVDNSIDGLRDACCAVAQNYGGYASQTVALRDSVERRDRWQIQASCIKGLISGST